MSLSKVFIIRHGETDYNLNQLIQGRSINAPLNTTGRAQAAAIGNYLKTYSIDRVICSALMRTHQTAEPVLKHFGLDLIAATDLDEMNFGKYEGMKFESVTRELLDIQQRWKSGETDAPLPGGESPLDTFKRADLAVRHYLDQFQGETVVFFIHGRLIRILLSEWTGLGLKNMHRIEHSNGAINSLLWDGSGFQVEYLNKIDHLGDWIAA